MKFTGIQGIIRKNQRKMESESDWPDKIRVKQLLTSFRIFALTDKYVLFDKNLGYLLGVFDSVTEDLAKGCFWHKPDLVAKPDLVIEIDGWDIHGGNDEATMTEKTRTRNTHYLNAGMKLIVVDKATLEVLEKSWEEFLLEELRSIGLVA